MVLPGAKPPLDRTAHRPWLLPDRRWVLAMRWHDLLFAHWRVPPETLRPHIPGALELDTFDGSAWIGIVPFRMSGVRLRYVPSVGPASAFPELNVRTYVTTPGRAGVWFFSLDAASRVAVSGARIWYGLPYFDAHMEVTPQADGVRYRSQRVHRAAPPAELDVDYRPTGPVYQAEPGTLDHWLTERYCLYAVDPGGRVRVGDIHHLPWPLQPAEAEFRTNTMTEQIGVALPAEKPLLHFARHLEVGAWRAVPLKRDPVHRDATA